MCIHTNFSTEHESYIYFVHYSARLGIVLCLHALPVWGTLALEELSASSWVLEMPRPVKFWPLFCQAAGRYCEIGAASHKLLAHTKPIKHQCSLQCSWPVSHGCYLLWFYGDTTDYQPLEVGRGIADPKMHNTAAPQFLSHGKCYLLLIPVSECHLPVGAASVKRIKTTWSH